MCLCVSVCLVEFMQIISISVSPLLACHVLGRELLLVGFLASCLSCNSVVFVVVMWHVACGSWHVACCAPMRSVCVACGRQCGR